jgi:sugar-specific transcriptional regulator TrmB/DNA-binding CsgD family transcriptional regulator
MLDVLGLEPAEEAIYRSLVTHAGASAADLAALTGRTRDEVADALTRMVARGLAATEPSVPAAGVTVVFTAAPPSVALGSLLRQRRDDLHQAEQDLAALAEEHRISTMGRQRSHVIEEITDINAVRHRFLQIQETAEHEVLSMVRPNLSVVPHRENVAEKAGLRRGVHYRAILDRKALSEPGMLEDAIASMAAGQDIRLVDHVPVKVVIVDRARAMVPLLPGPHEGPESMLVQSSGILDALIQYFESTWEHAHPLLPNGASELVGTQPDINDLDKRILTLLLSGMTDQAVASQLGLSRRTVQRRISELMIKAHAETRIELGWCAARRGWA